MVARVLTHGGSVAADSLGAYLQEALPDDFWVVADAVLEGRPYDAIVVGPGGITILQQVEAPHAAAPTPETRQRFETWSKPAIDAAQMFLADEFPRSGASLAYLPVVRAIGEEGRPAWRNLGPAGGPADAALPETLTTSPLALGVVLADPGAREELAVALRDRRITSSQRAPKPFVFRSGGLLRVGRKAWTIRDAVHHMDRHPEDGIYHLANGTLESWLRVIGADHLADLAHTAILHDRTDRRAALEAFLQGSGLVRKPALRLRPKRLDLGYIVAGENATGCFRIQRGRGRGYLVGRLSASDPWIDIEPAAFSGGQADIAIHVSTRELPIQAEPHRAAVRVDSNAAAAHLDLPVCFRVVAAPGPLIEHLARPLAGFLLGAGLGAATGLLWAAAGMPLPPPLQRIGPVSFWLPLIGLVWGIAGAFRAGLQPRAWPTAYGLARWLMRLAGWAVLLGFIGLAAAWGWGQGLGGGWGVPGMSYAWAALCGLAAGVLPATLAEIAAGNEARNPRAAMRERRVARSLLRALTGIALLVVLLLAPRAFAPALRRAEDRGVIESAGQWVTARWERLNSEVNTLLDQLILRYYEQRSPQGTPTVLPTRVPTRTPVQSPTGTQRK